MSLRYVKLVWPYSVFLGAGIIIDPGHGWRSCASMVLFICAGYSARLFLDESGPLSADEAGR